LNAPVRAVPLLRTRWGTLAPADDLQTHSRASSEPRGTRRTPIRSEPKITWARQSQNSPSICLL